MEVKAAQAELARLIAAEGQTAMRQVRLAANGVYVRTTSFRAIARTRDAVTVAVARHHETAERGVMILRACADAERALEARLDEREQALLEAQRALAKERARR